MLLIVHCPYTKGIEPGVFSVILTQKTVESGFSFANLRLLANNRIIYSYNIPSSSILNPSFSRFRKDYMFNFRITRVKLELTELLEC